jgi:hypothetical protein
MSGEKGWYREACFAPLGAFFYGRRSAALLRQEV